MSVGPALVLWGAVTGLPLEGVTGQVLSGGVHGMLRAGCTRGQDCQVTDKGTTLLMRTT